MGRKFLTPSCLLCTAIFSVIVTGGCAVGTTDVPSATVIAAEKRGSNVPVSGAAIAIKPESPAETVKVFYKLLREKRFREAIFLTNLRPAIEGLTDTQLKEFQVDFEAIAMNVPAELEINGEIVSGDNATVTAKIPDDETGKSVVQEIRLKRANDVWMILTVDAAAEQRIKKEGKNYFYSLRIETHEDEARSMLERIAKAELAYSVQNGGLFADIPALIDAQLLPDDARTAASTGYVYAVLLLDGNKRYSATATPAEYGKSGRLSFVFESDGRRIPKIFSKDNGGKPLSK